MSSAFKKSDVRPHSWREGEPVSTINGGPTFQQATSQFQRRFVEKTLLETGWNVSEAARRLGLARSHVYNLIHAFGLKRVPRNGQPRAIEDHPGVRAVGAQT
jgi:transcriptional regulator with GAF, ATPase, and Fis domain